MNETIEIDWEQLHHVSEDDPEFELELLTMLAEDVKIHIADLRRAAVDRDAESLAHEAHYIKGASANVGVTSLATLAKEVETIARDRLNSDPVPLIERMACDLERLESYIASRN